MPIKLVEPREGKSPNFTIRGTYLGVHVDKSSGTHKRSVANSVLKALVGQIERGEYPPREAPPRLGEPTFLSAAVAYMEAGKRRKYVAALIKHFGETPLSEIDEATINAAAIALKPNVTAGTRNAYVYTPTLAILRHAGIKIKFTRPKGATGRVVTDWLPREDAFAIIDAAEEIDRELALYLRFLLYTGLRPHEVLKLRWEEVQLAEGAAWVRRGKGGATGSIRLREDLRDGMAAHRQATESPVGRVFRFHQGGHLKHMLVRAKLAVLGIPCPVRRPTGWRQPRNRFSWVNFKVFRHTWATWMRRYGGLDEIGLVATGNWRDVRSARRYAHAVAAEEWSRVDVLPANGERRKA